MVCGVVRVEAGDGADGEGGAERRRELHRLDGGVGMQQVGESSQNHVPARRVASQHDLAGRLVQVRHDVAEQLDALGELVRISLGRREIV